MGANGMLPLDWQVNTGVNRISCLEQALCLAPSGPRGGGFDQSPSHPDERWTQWIPRDLETWIALKEGWQQCEKDPEGPWAT